MIFKTKIQRVVASVVMMLILYFHVAAVPILAEEISAASEAPAATQASAPEAPAAPSAPEAPTAPSAPVAPTAPQAPTPSAVAPTAPAAPTPPSNPNQEAGRRGNNNERRGENGSRNNANQSQNGNNAAAPQGSTGTSGSGNVGDTGITTGSASNASTTSTVANTNAAGVAPSGVTGGSGASVNNSGNGAGSTNGSSANVGNTTNTNQSNSANVGNNVNQNTVTGNNSASMNVGDSNIKTGDANTTGTIINAVNTNVDGVLVSEFNITDDHVGDIILDFGNPSSCVIGCGGGNVAATNSGNGANSHNTANSNSTNTDNTFQSNDGDIENNMVLNADSGHNDTNLNTGGDSNIHTGDANVSANVLTFLNNNLSGNVVLGVVNIFGNLVGDIIFQDPGSQNCSSCGGNLAATNSGNGAGSDNTANTNSTNTNNTFQSNDATIENNLILDAQTGNNDVNGNTNGNSSVTTGNTSIDANVLNIANMNIAGGDVWLVIVNEAGNWIGRILGAPEGSNFAGSVGTEFMVGPNGEITAYNSGNGAGSTNQTNTNSNNTSNTTQTNNANVVNNINLSANTGGNSSSYNTGGNSSITTGDAAIIANLVNFVNNNVTGGGKLYVNVVNVFGSWMGDFVTPGQTKQPKPAPASSDNTAHVGGQAPKEEEKESVVAKITHITPTPTKTTAGVSATVTKKKMAAVTVKGKGGSVLGTDTTGDGPDNTQNEAVQEADDAMEVNLAWFLTLLPFVPIGFVERKYGFMRSAAHRLLSIVL